MTILRKWNDDEEDVDVQCSECDVIFCVIYHRNALHDGIEYCPFCGDAVESIEGFRKEE